MLKFKLVWIICIWIDTRIYSEYVSCSFFKIKNFFLWTIIMRICCIIAICIIFWSRYDNYNYSHCSIFQILVPIILNNWCSSISESISSVFNLIPSFDSRPSIEFIDILVSIYLILSLICISDALYFNSIKSRSHH